MRPTTRRLEGRPPQLSGVLRQLAPVQRRAVDGMPASAAIAATVSGASPDSTFSSHALARKNATVSRASGRRRSPEDDEAEQLEVTRRGSVRAAGRRAARARRSCRARRRGGRSAARATAARRAGRARRAPARRARSVAPSSAQRRSSGAATRTERARRAASASAGKAFRDAVERRVGARRARRVAAERVGQELARPLRARAPRRDAERGLGERAGLVEADHVGRRQRLDRVQLLGEGATAAMRSAATAYVRLASRIRPSGTSSRSPRPPSGPPRWPASRCSKSA